MKKEVPSGSHGQQPNVVPRKDSNLNLPSSSKKYKDSSPFAVDEYDDFARGVMGDKIRMTGLSKSPDEFDSEDYDHFVETPEMIKRPDDFSKQAKKEAVLNQYGKKPPKTDNRHVKKKTSNF